MYFIRLTVKDRPLLQYTSPFMYLYPLVDDGEMKRPKHVVGK